MRTEDAIQRSMVEWLELCVPPPPEGPIWTAINPLPNKTKAQAGMSKAMGLKAGWPDLAFIWKGRFVGPEVKPPGEKLSKVQEKIHAEITAAGGVVTVVHSVDELQDFLRVLGVPMRGVIAA